MGIRETLNEHSKLTAGVVGTVALLATTFVVMQVFAGRRTVPGKLPDSYFTNDDGKTFFEAGSDSFPPFERNGKTAVHAYIFQCCGKRFVGYMERYNSDAHKLKVAGKGTPETEMYGMEVKQPGGSKWIKAHDLATANKVTEIKCPHGASATPEPVEP
ncbi:MAG: hypothetical protein H7Z14_20055 [Anaerolineae bacterium]|nr:hypothetical protein [Phycisphaerae bacterium]